MRTIIILWFLAFISSKLHTQTINQPGEVRAISYQIGVKGTPIADVRIKSLVEVRSDSTGNFVLPVSNEGTNYFTFTEIFKPGYELITPSIDEFGTKRFAINPGTKLTIVMANRNERTREANRIEEQIRREKEGEIEQLENQIKMLTIELETLHQQNSTAEELAKQIENLQTELQQFREAYYESDEMIRKEAERLSRIDFQTLDSLQAVIVNLLKEGRGEEVVITARSQFSDELWNKIMTDPGSLKRDLEQKTQFVHDLTYNYQQDSLVLEQMAQQLKNVADGFAAIFLNDSAAFYLKKRMELAPERLDFTKDYADYISEYQGMYGDALQLYQQCLEKSWSQFGENSAEAASFYNQIGLVYSGLNDYTKAIEYNEKALAIRLKLLGEEHPDVTTSKHNIRLLNTLLSSHKFIFDVEENGVAFNKGLRGKYIVLYHQGWEMGERKNLISHIPTMLDKSKHLLLLNDEGIHEYHFEPGPMGLSISIEAISKREEKRILEMYEEWKRGR